MSQALKIIIKSPDRDIFSGEAVSLSSQNSAGKFDVLPGHANFITVIENKPIIIRQKPGNQPADQQVFTFPLAIISVNQDLVRIYTNIDIQPIK
jgi:F0F1-type ATP synthase epsilon subunit